MRTREEIEDWVKTIRGAEKAFGVESPGEKIEVAIEVLLDIRDLLQDKVEDKG